MTDVSNGKHLVEASGVQFLVDVCKVTARQRVQMATAAAKPGAAAAEDVEDRAQLLSDTVNYARQTLLNLTKVPAAAADAAFGKCVWGRYGDLMEVDELKWDVEAERKRCMALLQALRSGRK